MTELYRTYTSQLIITNIETRITNIVIFCIKFIINLRYSRQLPSITKIVLDFTFFTVYLPFIQYLKRKILFM